MCSPLKGTDLFGSQIVGEEVVWDYFRCLQGDLPIKGEYVFTSSSAMISVHRTSSLPLQRTVRYKPTFLS